MDERRFSVDTPVMFGATERYRVVRELGRGSSGIVHEGFDRRFQRRVAIKTLIDVAPDQLAHLKQEFRVLADVVHPHLVELGELVVGETGSFFTMELVDGCDAAAFVRSPGRDPGESIDAIAVHTALGLRALHRAGKLHRDLKASNVLVDRDGRARIVDYGLASDAASDRARGFRGTPAFAAPETLLTGAASPASDCYALGVMLYELATGARPFFGSLAEQVVAKSRGRFGRLAARGDLPIGARTRELVDRLLDPDPARRATVADVLSSLGAPAGTISRAPEVSREILGRDEPLDSLVRALTRSRNEGPRVVFVRGASGLGKTALIETFCARAARSHGALVLFGRCRPDEKVPHRALDAAIDDLVRSLRRLPPDERGAVLDGTPAMIARLFPVMRSVAQEEMSSTGDALEQRASAVRALRTVLARLAGSQPLILAIDDVQWAGDDDIAVVRELLAGGGAPRMLLVLAGRADTPARLVDALSSGGAHPADAIDLAPLSPELAREIVARRSGVELDRAAIDAIVAAALGNPFELESSALVVEAIPSVGVGSFATLARARLERIPPGARRMVELASVSSSPIALDLLLRTTTSPVEIGAHAGALVKSRLLRWCDAEGETLAPYHERIREAVREGLDEETRVALHDALAAALEGWELATPEQLVEHHVGARRFEAASRHAAAAGRDASARFAFAAAVRFYRIALEHAPPEADRAELHAALGEALARTGDGPGAAEHLLAAARGASADARRALESRAASALLRTGHVDRGRELLRDALSRAGAEMPRSSTRAIAAFLYWTARRALVRTRPPQDVLSPDLQARLDALWAGATTLSMFDPIVANALQARFSAEVARSGDARRQIRALALDAAFDAALGGSRRARARASIAALRGALAACPWPYEVAWVVATLGSTAWLGGDFPVAVEETTRARALFETMPDLSPYEIALVDSWRLPSFALVGDLEALEPALSAAESAAESRADVFALGTCRQGHVSVLWLARGEPDGAQERADRAMRAWGPAAPPTPLYHHVLSRTRAELYQDRADRACAILDEAWPRLAAARLLDLEMIRADLEMLRCQARLWLALQTSSRSARRAARNEARALAARLERSTLAIGPAWAALLRGRIEGRDDDGSLATRFDAAGLRLHGGLLRGQQRGASWSVTDSNAMARALLPPRLTS